MIAKPATKICFNLGNGKDIQVMSSAMNLKEEEKRYIDKLRIGQAIAKCKHRYTESVLLSIELSKVIRHKNKKGRSN